MITRGCQTITRAVCRQADSSRTDGGKIAQLPSPVMSPDVNLAAIDHSDVASDTNRLAARLFLTDYCEALSNADDLNEDFHLIMNNLSLRALGGSYSTSSVLVQKNRVPISFENKYSVVVASRACLLSTAILIQYTNVQNQFD